MPTQGHRNYKQDIPLIVDSLPIFSSLKPFAKKLITLKSEIAEYKKGENIYREGDKPDYFYCIVSGRVEIFHPPRKARTRREAIIECVRRGDYFGSISAITGRRHTVSARVLNDSLIIKIPVKDFNYILRKVPPLALFMARSLSRRLGQRPYKEIFESKIIAVFSTESNGMRSNYTRALALALKKESGKKVLVVDSGTIKEKRNVSPRLSAMTGKYHYILVDVVGILNPVNFEILKQADLCHIVTGCGRISLIKTGNIARRLKGGPGKPVAFIVLNEDKFYKKSSYAHKLRMLAREVYATLPIDKKDYKKSVRRIAREVSGVMVGLALGSGAAMGLAHIGVLKVFEKNKIPIDCISGTSMGGLIAAFWATGMSADEIRKIVSRFKSKLKLLALVDPALPLKGLIRGKGVKRFLKTHLGNKTFRDTKLPLKIIACDIRSRKEFVIEEGSLVDAVMASIAIPGVFVPVRHKTGIELVDGGIINPVPVSALSKAGIKRIIAVNTLPSSERIVQAKQKKLNIYDIIVKSFQAMEYTIAVNSCLQADIHLNPIPAFADWYEFYKAELFIKRGREDATAALPAIRALNK